MGRFGKELLADFLLGYGLSLNEFFHFLQVLGRVERKALAFSAVAPGAPGLLIVALEALGHIVVDYVAHVGFVDAHAECNGSHDYVDLLQQECVLVGGAGGGIHAGMVGESLDIVHLEEFGHFLDLFAA